MALNIPVNLMSVAIPPPQQSVSAPADTAVSSAAAVQPAAASSNTSNTFTNNGNGQGASGQQAQTAKQSAAPQPSRAAPDKAEAKSVVTAQIGNSPFSEDGGLSAARRAAEANQATARTDALVKSIGAAPKETSITLEKPEQEEAPTAKRQSEIDRYAPPDPLPTAPILKAAESYSAVSKRN